MALEGTLQDMSLSDLIQIFRMGSKSGVLLLVAPAERGIVYVVEGRLIDALIVQGSERSVIAAHDEAVLQMMTWDEAHFTFRHDLEVSHRPVRIVHDGEWLVMEGMRRRDDPLRAMPYHTITKDTRLQLSPLPSSAESGVSLDVNQWRILSQVSSCQSLGAICDATGLDLERARKTVAELLSIGLLEIVQPPASPSPASTERRAQAEQVRQAAMAPAFAGPVDGGKEDQQHAENVGRGLLDAIMRRIRGL